MNKNRYRLFAFPLTKLLQPLDSILHGLARQSYHAHVRCHVNHYVQVANPRTSTFLAVH